MSSMRSYFIEGREYAGIEEERPCRDWQVNLERHEPHYYIRPELHDVVTFCAGDYTTVETETGRDYTRQVYEVLYDA